MTERDLPASPSRPIYVARVNAAVDYIEAHLDEDLTLEQVADVAHFSPFHFHRIFGLLVGETLGRFITRLRLERAATLLIQHPDRPVTEIASSCGIYIPSSFARSFRDMFRMSATEWRSGGYARADYGSVRDLLGNIATSKESYGITRARSNNGRTEWDISCGPLEPTSVAVVDVPTMEVAYVRYTGRYQGAAEVFTDIFTRLMTWAGPRGLVNDETWVMSVYHDNPSITDDEKLRVSACIDVPAGTTVDGDIGRMTLEGGPCAIARFELGVADYGYAWYAVAGGWMPDSGYEPDDRLPFERFPSTGSADTTTPANKEVVDICIPVRPLRP